MTWSDGLSQRARERLTGVGGLSEADRQAAAEEAQLDTLLRRFYRDELTAGELLQHLRKYEEQRKWTLLRSTREKLKASFKWSSLGFTFTEAPDGSIALSEGNPAEPEPPAAPGIVQQLTDATFDAAVKANAVLVVDCWATWCGPCRMVAPVIEQLARDYAGRVAFAKLDVDCNHAIASRYRVQSIPTILVFKGGRLVDQKLGAMPRAMLEPAITRHLDAPAV